MEKVVILRLRTSQKGSPELSRFQTVQLGFKARRRAGQNQRTDPADVAVEADHEQEGVGGQGPDDVGQARDLGVAEVEAEAEIVEIPREVEGGAGPSQGTGAGGREGAIRRHSHLCSRKYQVQHAG